MKACGLFYVSEDIMYFKKLELRTKMGRRGRILEPLGKWLCKWHQLTKLCSPWEGPWLASMCYASLAVNFLNLRLTSAAVSASN